MKHRYVFLSVFLTSLLVTFVKFSGGREVLPAQTTPSGMPYQECYNECMDPANRIVDGRFNLCPQCQSGDYCGHGGTEGEEDELCCQAFCTDGAIDVSCRGQTEIWTPYSCGACYADTTPLGNTPDIASMIDTCQATCNNGTVPEDGCCPFGILATISGGVQCGCFEFGDVSQKIPGLPPLQSVPRDELNEFAYACLDECNAQGKAGMTYCNFACQREQDQCACICTTGTCNHNYKCDPGENEVSCAIDCIFGESICTMQPSCPNVNSSSSSISSSSSSSFSPSSSSSSSFSPSSSSFSFSSSNSSSFSFSSQSSFSLSPSSSSSTPFSSSSFSFSPSSSSRLSSSFSFSTSFSFSSSFSFSTSQSLSSSSSSSAGFCGDGVVNGTEQCDNGSVCTQNPSISCLNDTDCRRCLITGGIGRCGGSLSGNPCTNDAQCANAQYFCAYDTFADFSCTNTCRRPSSSSFSFSPSSSRSSSSSRISSSFSSSFSFPVSFSSFTFTSSSSSSSRSLVVGGSSSSGCIYGTECESGLCIDGQCVISSSSSSSSSQSVATFSDSSVTVSSSSTFSYPGCRSDSECATGRCLNGSCFPCNTDNECLYGRCINNQCQTPTVVASGPLCGNGILENGEQCDDGNVRDGDGCSSSCGALTIVAAAPLCGNGVLESTEECDDGNSRDRDGCTSTCLLEIGICGDGIVQKLLGEQCESSTHDSSLPYFCVQCRFASTLCGNGALDPGEECDNGNQNSTSPDAECRPNCSRSRCGDTILDSSELCDDGNKIDGDGCDRFCRKDSPTLVASEYQNQNIAFPIQNSAQPLPFQLPLANLQPLIQSQAPVGDTGPAALAVLAGGAGAGLAWVRRKRRK